MIASEIKPVSEVRAEYPNFGLGVKKSGDFVISSEAKSNSMFGSIEPTSSLKNTGTATSGAVK